MLHMQVHGTGDADVPASDAKEIDKLVAVSACVCVCVAASSCLCAGGCPRHQASPLLCC
jgi:hypothetical protein